MCECGCCDCDKVAPLLPKYLSEEFSKLEEELDELGLDIMDYIAFSMTVTDTDGE